MGFHQRNSANLLLALLGLGSFLGVNGSWLFGAMEEREQDYRRAMQPRQFVQCSSGSKACGGLGCIASRRCCNADAEWACLSGNACYTANGYIDCYSTTMVMPTVSRKCYDYSKSGCSLGQACFTCPLTEAYCATEVIAGGSETWLACATKSMILTVTPGSTSGSGPTPTNDAATTPTGRGGIATPTRTSAPPTNTSTPNKLSGGAIAGIAVGGLAGIALVGALIFFLCKKGDRRSTGAAPVPQQYQQPQLQIPYPQPQPPYSPPPQQQPPYMSQSPYGQLPGYQGQMPHNGYGPDGQPMVSPMSSPVYPEPPKQPPTMPAELH